MNPLSSTFKFSPLKDASQYFRLLKLDHRHDYGEHATPITMTMEVFDLQDPPAYTSLSYTWGTLTPTEAVLVNAASFQVRQNLYDFLNMFRREATARWLWVDQLSINQQDTVERNQQVEQMVNIYRNAEQVLTWLGPSADGSDELMDALNQCREELDAAEGSAYASLEEACSVRNLETHLDAVDALFSRDYWTRLWIIQEILLARNIIVYCGSRCVRMQELGMIANQIDIGLLHGPDSTNHTRLWHLTCAQNRRESYPMLSLAEAIVRFGAAGCEDPRDTVFGLLSIVVPDQRPQVCYDATPEHVFADTCQRLCESYKSGDIDMSSLSLALHASMFKQACSGEVNWLPISRVCHPC